MRPAVCRQISGPVEASWALGLPGLAYWLGWNAPGVAAGDPVGHRVIRVGVLWSDRSRTNHDFRPEGPQELALLFGDLIGHGEDALVAPLRRNHGQSDAGVARRRFDDGATETEQPVGFGGIEHCEGRPVLDAATGIEVLELGQQMAPQVSPDPVEPNERRLADEIECALSNLHRRTGIGYRVHLDPLWRSHRLVREQDRRKSGLVDLPGDLGRQQGVADNAD